MYIDPEKKEKIEKIIAGFKCPKDFKCCKSGFKDLCKAKEGGLEDRLDCLEKDPSNCVFAGTFELPLGLVYYCRSPLRTDIAKELKPEPGDVRRDKKGK